jgi:hypothetical protein
MQVAVLHPPKHSGDIGTMPVGNMDISILHKTRRFVDLSTLQI